MTIDVNKQPAEKQHLTDFTVEVHSIFDTIQGEGPFAGSPAVFIRLTGCNLQCQFCDTEYTSVREAITPVEALNRVKAAHGDSPRGLVVLTGGEPFRQNISPLCAALLHAGYHVQIETNGTMCCLLYTSPSPRD